MPFDLDALRREFPSTQNGVFLNHAAASPTSTSAAEAMRALIQDQVHHGISHSPDWARGIAHAREAAAALARTTSDRVAFTRSTFDGLALAAHGIAWQPGDNVVIPEVEFPTNTYPWMNLAAQGVALRRVPIGPDRTFTAGNLRAHVDARTRVVAASWVQFSSGFRCDLASLAQLCRDVGALFVVDVIQGLGALSFDFEASGADLACAGAHKFLLGPHGVGVAYVSQRAQQALRVATVGWLSVNAPFEFRYQLDFLPDARRFEPGTDNAIGIHGLGAAMQLFLKHGPPDIERHILSLNQHLADGLRTRGYDVLSPQSPGARSAILIFNHARHTPAAIKQRLDEAGIATSIRGGGVRASPHGYNSMADIDQLLQALPG